jgi:TetR/AcrR family transcriptional repressor of cmeABC operon
VQQREQRRRKFIGVAEALFLRHGYAGTSVNQVVRMAGGSLATLYAEFGTKQGLFEAVMQRRAGAAFARVTEGEVLRGDINQRLTALAARIHARTLSRESLAIYRLAVAEGPRLRGLRQAVLGAGLDQFLARLAGLFAGFAAAGELAIDDTLLAAQRFLALVQGQHQFIAGCGERTRLSADATAQHVEHAVAAFLRIYPPPR